MPRVSLPSLLVPVLLGAAGCNGLLGISPPRDSEGDGDGDAKAGSAGVGNAPSSGGSPAGMGGAGEGGAAGESAGGASAGVGTTGGTGGISGSAGHAGSGARGGAGAAGGASGEFPVAGEPCATPGALACQRAASTGRLLCNGRVWEETDECTSLNDDPALCDRRTGTCGRTTCKEPGLPANPNGCTEGAYMACGPDRVTLVRVECVLGCFGNDSCQTPNENQLIIDEPPDLEAGNQAWPDPIVPVCWSDLDAVVGDSADQRRAAVRRAVDSTWGRVSGLGFTGWGPCRPDESRVELRFVDDCKGELVRLSRPGYPGPGARVEVEICKSYYGADHPQRSAPTDLDTLELVARHGFGHVLGFRDEAYDSEFPSTDIMIPVIDRTNPFAIDFTEDMLEELRVLYGPKPARSLVGPDGRCLSYDGGTLTGVACDGKIAQSWLPGDARLRHVETGKCLADTGAVVDCDGMPDQAWKLAAVRMLSGDGRCMVEGGPFPNDASLVPFRCRDEWPEGERFEIEFPAAGGVRIHASMDRCITAPESFLGAIMNTPVPKFGECDDDLAVFEVFEGTLSQRGYCLTVDFGSTVAFEPCVGDPPQQFYFSGPLELGGNALALLPSDAGGALSSAGLGAFPTTEQIFDYQF